MDLASATLAVNACMQVSFNFAPWKVGDHAEELTIHYDTGKHIEYQEDATYLRIPAVLVCHTVHVVGCYYLL